MKKLLFLVIGYLLMVNANSQKISKNHYKNVDTVLQFKNAEIIIYKDKFQKINADTIWFVKTKYFVNIFIRAVDYAELNDEQLLKRQK